MIVAPQPREADHGAIVIDLLREVLAELRALRADLRDGRPHQPGASLSRRDRARLSRLLPAIAAAKGSDPFLVNEVLALPAVRVLNMRNQSPHLGRLFRRAIGQPIDGFLVEHVGAELHRALWRVVAIVGDRVTT